MTTNNEKYLKELTYSINNISEYLQRLSCEENSIYALNDTLTSIDQKLDYIDGHLIDIKSSILKVADEIRIASAKDKDKERKLIELEKQLKKAHAGVNVCSSQMDSMIKNCKTCVESAEIEKTDRYLTLEKQHDIYQEMVFKVEELIEDLV
jgi:chromosome segregation ATPase